MSWTFEGMPDNADILTNHNIDDAADGRNVRMSGMSGVMAKTWPRARIRLRDEEFRSWLRLRTKREEKRSKRRRSLTKEKGA